MTLTKKLKLRATGGLVLLCGLLVINNVLFSLIALRHPSGWHELTRLTLLAGLTFIYLASLLLRGKRLAWRVAVPLFTAIVAYELARLTFILTRHPGGRHLLPLELSLAAAALTLAALLLWQAIFVVRSEVRNFGPAARRALVLLLVAFLYGAIGFHWLGPRNFHAHLSFVQSAHYTIDQFNLTTARPITAFTVRGGWFLRSLALISIGALAYVAISLFAPIRFQLGGRAEAAAMRKLVSQRSRDSEDFFKLWPTDKRYFVNGAQTAALAYHTQRGTALVAGDPVGSRPAFGKLLDDFIDYCAVNEWAPSVIHCDASCLSLYRARGFGAQKIGEEAVVDIGHFQAEVRGHKYFRQINNKFARLGYQCELLQPPHSPGLLARLRTISDDWLARPGRAERGFLMGYFDAEYLQQCALLVMRGADGDVQAFLNQVPAYQPREANFDLLRGSRQSPGNSNDFLLMNFIEHLEGQGMERLNLGLCPLAGLDAQNDGDWERRATLRRTLRFMYASGSRFYSFSGLTKFKAKYEPQWRGRYFVYRGGLPGFSRASTALLRAMRPPRPRRPARTE
jgi:phosphatidylglycerol lysyltransferase